ncbi:MAG: hypothetical protein ACYC0Q_15140 [Eubacteriales bacterium]
MRKHLFYNKICLVAGELEFFFLDEGFGSLNPELLEVVVSTLERLRWST